MKLPIYMDHHATTPLDPRVLERMMPFLQGAFGNAASRTHSFGWDAKKAVELARESIAAAISARPREIIFTSGATESNNLAILGAVESGRYPGRHLVTIVTEHKAVLDPCIFLEGNGFEVSKLPVDSEGFVDPGQVRDAIRDDTILVSMMMANNEIGVIEPVEEVGAITRERGVLFHSDAAQAAGKLPIDVDRQKVDLLSISGHKIYGPKGIGALFVRGREPRVRLAPQVLGGGHERGLRSGTLNVSGIVGLAAALEISIASMEEENARLTRLRDRLLAGIRGELEGVFLNGPRESRLAGNLNLSFSGVPGEALVMELKEIAVSTGSACTSADPLPSHVLSAIGIDESLVHASLRFGIGRFNTEEEIDYAVSRVVSVVRRLREQAP